MYGQSAKKMAVVERWPLVEVRVLSKTVVIISLKCLFLRETFVNLENGTKNGEFIYPRSLSVRKAGLSAYGQSFHQPRNSGVLTVWRVCYNNTFCCELLNRTGLGQCVMQASTELCFAFVEFFAV